MFDFKKALSFSLLFAFMSMNALAKKSDEQSIRYEYQFPVTQGLANYLLEQVDIFDLGAGVSQKFRLITDNDNFLLGVGGSIGLTKNNFIEGDDKGQTFGLSLEYIASFEAGEVSLKYFTELYSRSVYHKAENAITESLKDPENDRYYTENLIRDTIELEIKKDFENNYYAVIGLSVHHLEDSGMALSIQQGFHELTEFMGHRPYSIVETDLYANEVNGSVAVGKRFIITKSQDLETSVSTEVGYNFSNTEYWRAGFIKTSLDLIRGKSKYSFYVERDSKEYRKFGLTWDYTIHSDSAYEISTYLGIYKQENEYTKQYFDLGYESEIIHEYGLEVKF